MSYYTTNLDLSVPFKQIFNNPLDDIMVALDLAMNYKKRKEKAKKKRYVLRSGLNEVTYLVVKCRCDKNSLAVLACILMR